jgi:hypothetical protein
MKDTTKSACAVGLRDAARQIDERIARGTARRFVGTWRLGGMRGRRCGSIEHLVASASLSFAHVRARSTF